MYLRKMRNVNTGPIDDIVISFPFSDNKPLPLIIVGENGSGKSELLSFIVDSLYELAGNKYSDVRMTGGGISYQYYKSISPVEIKIGKDYMYSYIEYAKPDEQNKPIGYLLTCGAIPVDEFKSQSGFSLAKQVHFENDKNFKRIYVDKKDVEDIFDQGSFCYFGPSRYGKPVWLGEKYYSSIHTEGYYIKDRFSDQLSRPILVDNPTSDTLSWLLDIIADSRCDVETDESGNLLLVHSARRNFIRQGQARANIEQIISLILGEEVFFGLNNRSMFSTRFNICKKADETVLVQSLESLSTGQLALFNMFATIVRYADWNNINNSVHIENIKGIVLIDEIELHLHADLQRNVLPRLISLFPQVQFVITTHSPLFLLGMDEYFGDSNYQIIELPSGKAISSEAYSQFQNAYTFFTNTRKHQEEIANVLAKHDEKPLIVTEGASDWKHMKAALLRLQASGKYTDIDISFLEYEPKNSDVSNAIKLEMSNSELREACRGNSIMPQKRKLIFIADADDTKTTNFMSDSGKSYKSWGNNVFSFVLPLPKHRCQTPTICIEHYYTDDEIKTPMIIEGIERRLYMGCEFDKFGFSNDKQLYCPDRNSCGPGKINIIDGTEDKRVWKIVDENTNPEIFMQAKAIATA